MNMQHFKSLQRLKSALQSALFFVVGLTSAAGYAAPGTLSKVPLYMSNGVTPNVLWVVDDSLSMASEVTRRPSIDVDVNGNETQTGYPEQSVGCISGDYCNYVADIKIPTTSDYIYTKQELLESCFEYNLSAFNPEIHNDEEGNFEPQYLPWTNADGTPFNVHDFAANGLTNVPTSPYPGAPTINLTYAKFMDGDDLDGEDVDGDGFPDGDGKFDRGECYEDETLDADEDDDGQSVEDKSYTFVSSLSEEQQQDYVNWFIYYRERTFALKAALSDAIAKTEMRFGLATINNYSNAAFEIADMKSPDENGVSNTNKADMMTKLITEVQPRSSQTPLKQALHNAGKYYHQLDGELPESGFIKSGWGAPANPIQESCQANYTVLMTDGYRNNDPDTYSGNDDSDIDNSDANEFNGGSYGDSLGGTMADLAMKYYSADLSDKENNFSNNDTNDKNSAQHMVTYTIAFGVKGNIDPDTAQPETWSEDDTMWPATINNNSPETIDDLYHAAYNGRGQFFSSDTPLQLRKDIETIIKGFSGDIAGTGGSVGFNSTSISEETLLFQSWFNNDNWFGRLKAYRYDGEGEVVRETYDITDDPTSGITNEGENSLEWDSGALMDARVIDEGADTPEYDPSRPRSIYTYDSATNKGIVFKAPADYQNPVAGEEITVTHINDLLSHSGTPDVGDVAGRANHLQKLIDWVKGDRRYEEEDSIRTRKSVMGDIVYSSPQYVAAPNAPYPNNIEVEDVEVDAEDAYDNFISAQSDRTPMVYVGANDGMLHAIKAVDGDNGGGEEVFAYMPELLFSDSADRGIHKLAEGVYEHTPYVDGTPTVGDVFIGGDWRTYLVGGLNGGGKGIYVLDITDPDDFVDSANSGGAADADEAEDLVVTEFTHPNLGYTYARPQIGKLNNGDWAAIFGNGYNNTGSGEASLFILNLSTHNAIEISTGAGTTASGSCDPEVDEDADCNGLSSPSVIDLNADGIIDRVYAGDVHGNMWAFDLSSNNSADWDDAGSVYKLFVACRNGTSTCNSDADRQPITTKPVVVGHPDRKGGSTYPNVLVMFGTGQFLAEGDAITDLEQSFYTVWDAGPTYENRTRADLIERTIVEEATYDVETVEDDGTSTFTTVNGANRRILPGGTAVSYSTTEETGGFGWFVDLPSSRERMVLTPLIVGRFVSFVTSIPDVESCSGSGTSWLMAAEIYSGDEPDIYVFDNRLAPSAGVPLDNLSAGIVTLDNKYIGADAKGEIVDIGAQWQEQRPSRRASWSIVR